MPRWGMSRKRNSDNRFGRLFVAVCQLITIGAPFLRL